MYKPLYLLLFYDKLMYAFLDVNDFINYKVIYSIVCTPKKKKNLYLHLKIIIWSL